MDQKNKNPNDIIWGKLKHVVTMEKLKEIKGMKKNQKDMMAVWILWQNGGTSVSEIIDYALDR